MKLPKECDDPRIREMVVATGDQELIHKYEEMVKDCIVGDWAEKERSWVELCPGFPNLKGVSCKEIRDFFDSFAPDISHDRAWQDKLKKFRTRYDAAWEKMHERLREYKKGGHPEWKDPELEFWYDKEGEGYKLKKEVRDFLMKTLPEKENIMLEHVTGLDEMLRWASQLNQRYTREHGWESIPPRGLVRDYLRHVKVYDRDEEFLAMKRLGEELVGRIWDSQSPDERYTIVGRPHSPTYLEKKWSELSDNERKILKDTYLQDSNTVYVTTPRGGHEMLSIFAYANNIRKEQIPSDIHEPVLTPKIKIGTTWLGNVSERIQKVVIVDDIVASGAQISKAYRQLKTAFPKAAVYSVHLCHRDIPSHGENPLNPIDKSDPNYGHAVWDTTTIGLRYWKGCREWRPIKKEWERSGKKWHKLKPETRRQISGHYLGYIYNIPVEHTVEEADRWFEQSHASPRMATKTVDDYLDTLTETCVSNIITCLFPHACPDGHSDKLMTELMGEKRCGPEKRIGRRDL